MLNADVFVFRDDVQFVKNHKYPDGSRQPSYQMHTPIFGQQGTRIMNSQTKGKSQLPINQTEVSYEPDWTKKFLNILDECYRKADHYLEIRDGLSDLLNSRPSTISELNIKTTLWGLCNILGIPYTTQTNISTINKTLQNDKRVTLKQIALASELLTKRTEDQSATDRILQLCKTSECDNYVAGGTAIDSYFEMDSFTQAHVTVSEQQWQCEEYKQFSPGKKTDKAFIPNLSAIDLLANVSSEEALNILSDKAHIQELELVSFA